ncbi:uncharacterized protein BX664DRAFT_161612 [Halteromyces radiatus]|uniref:uncharacterized protein n=1 Tax=Halteromyces radiatus TaxID=101107 RepID=UPI00221F6A8E|nr:uncharacterized protein BX664DRAFT_161612 [Halteromyces radiatus]KAI8086620.1 hypothetical protein BX664DRAFT_161612 [Halteromyces radiatus]
MVFPPNNNNNNSDIYNNGPQSELELLEGLLNNMFNGATNMFFKSIQEPFLVEVDSSSQPRRQVPFIEDMDGSDFRRIAQKRRQRQHGENTNNDTNDTKESLTPSTAQPSSPSQQNVMSIVKQESPFESNNIWSLLLGGIDQQPSLYHMEQDDHQKNRWNFTSSSTSQRRTILSDGTEETVITTKRNGVTETLTRIKYPDGQIQETRQTDGKSDSSSIFPPLSAPSSSPSNNHPHTPVGAALMNNPLSRFIRSILG